MSSRGQCSRQHLWLYIICTVIAFSCNWQYGFSSSYLNTPVTAFKVYLNESFDRNLDSTSIDIIWDLIQNIWFVGYFLGIWLSPLFNDRIGRKYGLIAANSIGLVAAVLQFVGVWQLQPIVLVIGRLIASICTAVSFQANILYLQECPPTSQRGAISYLSEIVFAAMTIVGTMLGTDELFGDNLPALLAVNIPPCLLSVVVIFFVPETPKFLLVHRRNPSLAGASVRFFQGAETDVAAVLKETEIEMEADREVISSCSSVADLVREPYLRRALLLNVAALQNCVAFWAVIYNSTQFMKDIAVPEGLAKWSTTAMACCYFVGTVLGGQIIDRAGRRKIFLPCSAANAATLVFFVLFDELRKCGAGDWWKWGGVVSLLLFGFTYGLGVGGIVWFIGAELSPDKYRCLMQSAGYSINALVIIVATFSVLPLYNVLGSFCFLILLTLPAFFAVCFLFRYLPETSGREVHEIVADLKRK